MSKAAEHFKLDTPHAAVRVFAAFLLLLGVSSAMLVAELASPAAASPAGWTQGTAIDSGGWSQATPIDPLRGDLTSIACPTATFCAAVDGSGNVLTYDGSSWSSPVSVDSGLTGVSCPTATFCVAVGYLGDVFTYNGGSWSSPVNIDPSTGGAIGMSVSCPTANFCAVVDSNGDVITYKGSSWSSPVQTDSKGGFDSVSCATAQFCAAVDNVGNVLTYNGSSWSSPVSVDSGNAIASISCPTASFCAAVDESVDVLTYNGNSWSSPKSIDTSGDELVSISCPTTGFCAAVDYNSNVINYEGSSWSSPESIDAANSIDAVSCTTAQFCAAVDESGNVLTYDGLSWSSPDSIDPSQGYMTSVSCPTTTFCIAVDLEGNVLSYNGSAWTPPSRIDPTGNLMSVSCSTASFCAAVDDAGRALTYDGNAWSSPVSIDASANLESVSCPTASFCAAVDGEGNAFTYNGSSWSSPDSIDPNNYGLESVSCPTVSFCVALDGSGNAFTWTGSSWSSPVSIDPSTTEVIGMSVSCPTPSFCALVDDSGNDLTYDGSSWTSPARVPGIYFTSVSCPTSSFCSAVDANGNVLTYNGSSWSSPDSIDTSEYGLTSISCPTASFCAAVDWIDGNAFTYTSSSSPPDTSTTTITSVASSPVVGQSVSIGVQVTGPSTPSETPTGRVSVSDGTQSCQAPLSGSDGTATGSCSITEQTAGDYSLTASYPGDDNFGASATSASMPVTVGKASSTTALEFSSATVTYGDEGAEGLSVSVTPEFTGSMPAGTVTMSGSGSMLCAITLSGAKGSCTLSATQLAAGSYSLTASYAGSIDFTGSSTNETLTVAPASSTTSLSASVAKVAYGDEGTDHLSVSVTPEFSGLTLTGAVTVSDSSTTLCAITLSGGAGSCALSARNLPVGNYGLVAIYTGSADISSSASVNERLTVSKETSRVALKLSTSRVTFGHEGSEHISVSVSPEFTGSMPGGKVTVSVSSRTLCMISLSSGKGSCTLSSKKLSSGTYGLVATYGGCNHFDSSASTKETLKVVN
ncbi:MAG: Ig-like domain-containing protein [Acidimicrobiales bacterium]|jgi:uncharacterized Fe-S cluster protein YjdI